MSAALKPTPLRNKGEIIQSPRGGILADDGSLLITKEQLARFGDGDAERGRRELRLLLANSEERDSGTYYGPTPDPPASVESAKPEDEPAILALLMLDLRANAEHIGLVDEKKVLEHIRAGTRGRGGITAIIRDTDGTPIAVTILIPFQWWWGNGWYFFEIVNFVHPDHRKSRHIDDLLQYERWAADEATRLTGTRHHLLCGVLGAWRVQAKIALYRRKFKQQGAAFVYPATAVRGN